MRFAFHMRPARAVIALIGAGLIATPTVAMATSASAATTSPVTSSSACSWKVEALPMPEGFDTGGASGANDKGVFVGSGDGPTGESDLLVWRDGVVEVLETPGPWGGGGNINKRGVILGYDDLSPVVWVRGKATRLALPAGSQHWVAEDMNDSGTIVGNATIDGREHGLVWSAYAPTKVKDLGYADGQLTLRSISDSGQIFGTTRSDAEPVWRAVSGTIAGKFSYLPGVELGQESGVGTAAGAYVLGFGTPVGSTESVPLLWRNGKATVLPFTSVTSVNSKGVVVGSDEQGDTRLLQDGVLSPPLPGLIPGGSERVALVTDAGVLVGRAASAPNGWPTPAIWTCS